MLLNYIKIALRNILRNKLHSFINVMGLAIGIACAVLLFLMVQEIMSYDKHHSKHERIFMVQTEYNFPQGEVYSYDCAIPVGPALKNEFSAIEEYVRNFFAPRMFFMDSKGEVIAEDGICYADPQIFKVFDHDFIYGSPEGALDSPNTIVINRSLSQKYFGKENPVGKTLSTNNRVHYTVSGVFEDLPKNTIRHYNALLPMQEYANIYGLERFNSLASGNFFNTAGGQCTFILLHENSDIKDIESNFSRYHEKYIAEINKGGFDLKHVFVPLTDVVLKFKPNPQSPAVYLLAVLMLLFLALFILIIACTNYMNLATAQSEARALEVGVRKVMGAGRFTLVRQFLCESIVITLIAMLISLALIELGIPYVNYIEAGEISFNIKMSAGLLGELLLITLAVGILSGSYPALMLSSFLPVDVLRGGKQTGKSKGRLRKLLIIVQFTLAILAINCAILSQKQVDFWLNSDLGFNMDDILVIESNEPSVKKALPVFKEELLKNSDISSVSGALFTIGTGSWNTVMKIENDQKELVDVYASYLTVDYDFISMMGIDLLEGRLFNKEIRTDKDSALLINETVIEKMRWTDSPIGKRIMFGPINAQVIGVLKNFHFQSLYDKLKPMIVLVKDTVNEGMPSTYIKINPENSEKTIKFIERKWKELIPAYPFEYTFLKDRISKNYELSKRLLQIFNLFTLFCVFISCLGLFGLSSFVAARSTKEIGIRKVHGASVRAILIKITFSFMKLIIIAGIIASFMSKIIFKEGKEFWPYYPEINIWVVTVTVVCLVFAIALVTVSFHTLKAALTDPVKTLRYE